MTRYLGVGAALVSIMLSACGGGGDSEPKPSVSIDSKSVSLSLTPGENPEIKTVVITVTNFPESGLHVLRQYSHNALDAVRFVPVSNTTAHLQLYFKSPLQMEAGTYEDFLNIRVCLDEACTKPVNGSPMDVTVKYTVTTPISASIAQSTIEAVTKTTADTAPTTAVHINVTNPAIKGPYVTMSHTGNAVRSLSLGQMLVDGSNTVEIRFVHPQGLGAGIYHDTLTFKVCYDSSCTREVTGSPFVVEATYTVLHDALPEPGVIALNVLSRTALPHDVIDAEYSAALDAIVIASAWPSNALYVYDMASGARRQVTLSKAPTSVSVSPNGLVAAVGHDALISYITDLTAVGTSSASAPTLLHVSMHVSDIVLDGRGFVHATPVADQLSGVHSIEIATDTETLGNRNLHAGARARLHPSGDFLYHVNRWLSPGDIEKHDIRSGGAVYLYDSPYHDEYAMCGNLWFSEDGVTIYTACGNTFRSSTVQAQDMLYTGALQLSSTDHIFYNITSLSQSAEAKEIVLIESDRNCEPFLNLSNCNTHLNFYESDFLNRTAFYSIAPVTVANQTYAQRGLFVFHGADGAHVYMLSRLHEMPNPETEYYLSVVR